MSSFENKTNQSLKKLTLIFSIFFSFLLGRESVIQNFKVSKRHEFLSDSSVVLDDSKIINNNYLLDESLLNKVYRCGNSMIYHPTTSHASFKRCKSKISELSITKAKELGMRHCKCKS